MSAVVLEERINIERALYLLETLTKDQFLTAWEGKKTDGLKKYNKLMKYLNSKVSDSTDYVKYNYAKKRKNGRLIGENSIQTCIRDVRGFLCDGLTTDIDMDNCHPLILFTLCQKHEIHCPNLTLYINDRKKCLSEIMNNDDLNYRDAKKRVLISTNLDKRIKSKSDFLTNYDKEMKIIHKKFLDIEEYDYIKPYAKQEENFQGSFINHILCINENNILKVMRTYCDINKINIHSLMFDGLMVYGEVSDYTLKCMQKYVNENTIFTQLKLSFKSHEYDFEIPNDFKPKIRKTYDMVKKKFEKENCKVNHEFVCEKNSDLIICSRTNFHTMHEELKFINNNGIFEKFIDSWFEDEEKRMYDKYDSCPKGCPSNVYNLWVKFPVEIMPSLEPNITLEKSLNWFLNHIRVLVDYNETHYDFVLMWLAQMFQYPENKSMQLVFVGEEGTGKGTFVKFLTTMLGGGDRCLNTEDPQEDIFGKFNDLMKKAFLVVLNEADKSKTFNNNSILKGLITEPTINIRPKGEKSYSMRSCHRFMGFSNNPDPSTKNKRRDFTMKTSSCKVNDVGYFNEGNLYAKDINCCKFIYDYLMKHPCNPVITDKDIPVGVYDEMLKVLQKNPVIEFLEELTCLNEDKDEPVVYKTNTLYEYYLDYCKRNHVNYTQNLISFSSRLAFMKPNGLSKSVKKINKMACRVWVLDIKLLKISLNIKDHDEMSIIEDSEYDTD